MVDHFFGQRAVIATVRAAVVDAQRGVAFPGNAHAVVETFDPKRNARRQKTLAVPWDHFVQGHELVVTVYVHHVALKTLGTVVEGDDQRVMALL